LETSKTSLNVLAEKKQTALEEAAKFEEEMKTFKDSRDDQIKQLQVEISKLRKEVDAFSKESKLARQEFNELKLEIEELQAEKKN